MDFGRQWFHWRIMLPCDNSRAGQTRIFVSHETGKSSSRYLGTKQHCYIEFTKGISLYFEVSRVPSLYFPYSIVIFSATLQQIVWLLYPPIYMLTHPFIHIYVNTHSKKKQSSEDWIYLFNSSNSIYLPYRSCNTAKSRPIFI